MPVTRTTTELATAVLRELTQIDAAESASDHSEAATVVTDAYNDIYYRLRHERIAYWALAAIPVEVFREVRDLVINQVSGTFGQPIDPAQRFDREQSILRGLRRITGRAHTKNRTYAQYF